MDCVRRVMPKVKKSSEQSIFRVSPWITKKRKENQLLERASGEVSGEANSKRLPESEEDQSIADSKNKGATLIPAATSQICNSNKQDLVQKYIETLGCPSASPDPTTDWVILSGLVVLFPSGTLVGKSWVDPSEEALLEITGKQLSSGRDCLRDNDWQVYKISIVEAGKKPLKLLASKTGGNAANILAPMEMHGSEEEDYQQHLSDCSLVARLEFCCSIISDGSEAHQYIPGNPMEDAIVNFGTFKWQSDPGNMINKSITSKPALLYDSDLDA